ncbi:MAG: hypothetical protein CSA26_06100 [Desulfobacterales bacterium]|nr:MAG: hypothetical protein CSA26_06100 [Desulfobacterales bacterium]
MGESKHEENRINGQGKMMVQISREHLIDGFVAEIEGYIPVIREDLTALAAFGSEAPGLDRMYRLFHNIKGTAAQLSLNDMSYTARIIEDILESLLEGHRETNNHVVSFISEVTENIQKTCNGDIRDQEQSRKLLTKTISRFRELDSQPADINSEKVEQDILRLKAGESIIWKNQTPLDYLKRSRVLCGTIRTIMLSRINDDRLALLSEKLLKLIGMIIGNEKREDYPEVLHCVEALYELIDWLVVKEISLDTDVIDLLSDYLHFIELSFAHPELVQPGKIDHVIKTMHQLKDLSSPVVDEAIPSESFVPDTAEDLFLPDEIIASYQKDDAHESIPDKEKDIDLDEVFRLECEVHLQQIDDALNTLHSQVNNPVEITGEVDTCLSAMRRAIHTLKGAAGMTGFIDLSDFAHRGEEFLDVLFEEKKIVDPEDLVILADIAALLEEMSSQPDQIDQKNITEKKKEIERLLETKGDQQGNDKETAVDIGTELIDTAGILTDEKEDEAFSTVHEGTIVNDDDVFDSGQDILQEDNLTEPEDADLREIFRSESEEHLVTMSSSLVALEQIVDTPMMVAGEVERNLNELRRAIHTLKGAAGMTGFMVLSSFAHQSEDLLDAIFDSDAQVTPNDIDVLAEAVDMIELISLKPDMIDEDRLTRLSALIDTALAGHTSSEENTEGTPSPDHETRREPKAEISMENDGSPPETGQIDQIPDTDAPVLPGDTSNIRVRLDSLDELVRIESELIVGRSTMEQQLDDLLQNIEELNTAKGRLRRISHELETGFEIESLYGFGNEVAGELSGKSGVRPSEFSDFDPIELDRYSQLSLIIRSLNEISVDVDAIHTQMRGLSSELRGHMTRQQMMMGLMQDKLMRVRMTPMSSLSRSFFRTVRRAANRLDKQVRLLIEGEDVYLDRFIWTRIADPIMHILRNAVDHGIETRIERIKNGKPEQGTVKIEATQRGSHVVLAISDDGRGFDFEAIRKRLVQDKLVKNTAALDEDDLLEYLFVPGFSTRKEVSQLSGRGVGLDVVRQNVKELRGSCRIKRNQPGESVFELRIPVTLALNRAIIIRLEERRYAIPLHDVLEIRKIPVSDIRFDEKPTVKVGQKELFFRDLAVLIELRQSHQERLAEQDHATVLFVAGEHGRKAVAVDSIVEQQEIIVKDLGTHLKHVPGISGATIMGDGSLVPILNLAELVISAKKPEANRGVLPSIKKREEPLHVMVVDDSVSVRQSVSRLIKHQGWKVSMATDGIDAVEKIDEDIPDIIILDIEMPRMNGFEFMGVLRNSDRYQQIPVIMLTSRISDKHRSKARELGVNHYMSKPYQEDEFLDVIRETTGHL